MNKKISNERHYNSRFTIIEKKRLSVKSFKKSKTRITDKNKTRGSKEPKYLKMKPSQNVKIENNEIGSFNIEDIYAQIVHKVDAEDSSAPKKIKFDQNGTIRMITDQKGTDKASSRSKLELISGSLVNNYWAGESSLIKGGISRLEDHTILEISETHTPKNQESVNDKLKKATERARDLVHSFAHSARD